VTKALAQLPQPPREFAIIVERSDEEPPVGFYSLPECEGHLFAQAFGNLRRLYLKPDSLHSDTLRLASLYWVAPNLEELVLEYDRLIWPYPVRNNLQQLPQLRHVELIGLRLRDSQLLNFLLNHSATLRILHLRNIILERLWKPNLELFRLVRQLRESKLDGFLLDQILHLYFSTAKYPTTCLIDFSKSQVTVEDYRIRIRSSAFKQLAIRQHVGPQQQ
jgi:hypothetical protein